MATQPPETGSYIRLGQVGAPSPLVIAVPHAGRTYPAEMMAAARLPRQALESIEDRHADLLVADAVAAGAVAIVARFARAYVDLNRDERELDPVLLRDRPAPGGLLTSPKVSGGLGVIPSRIAAGGAVWKGPLPAGEVEQRMARAHRPYHQAIAAAMDEADAAHGFAVLVDCHSMPPLGPGAAAPKLVIGDRHGRSADSRFVGAVMAAARAAGVTVTRNAPYAGGYALERHGLPRAGRHALQIEVDRSLYLDAALRQPGPGLAGTSRLFAHLMAAIEAEGRGYPVAAE